MNYRKKLFKGGPSKVDAKTISELEKNMSGNILGIPFNPNEVKERFQKIPKTKKPKPKTAYSERFYSKEELKKLEN